MPTDLVETNGDIVQLANDPNIDWDFPADFLAAFHATRGLCPGQPEGDYAFMHFLLALCEEYHATAAPPTAAIINSITPNTAPAGGPEFPLTVRGTGLKNGSIFHFGSANGPLTYVSETEGTVDVHPDAYALPGTIPVTVVAPGAPASNAVNFIAT